MLNTLYKIEQELPFLLKNKDSWCSVHVNYHKPYVKRLWQQVGENRIYLHQIFPCEAFESLLHPHPWPSAMKVINGIYEMGVGYSESNTAPPISATLILPQGSYYEMTQLHSWHYVRPLEKPSFSLMITGKPWQREVPKSNYKMPELTFEEKELIFTQFAKFYS